MKKILILLVIVIVISLIWWVLSDDSVVAPTENSETNPASIESELQGLGDEDLDTELQAIDADIKAL